MAMVSVSFWLMADCQKVGSAGGITTVCFCTCIACLQRKVLLDDNLTMNRELCNYSNLFQLFYLPLSVLCRSAHTWMCALVPSFHSMFSLPLHWPKLHDHTTKGYCAAVKALLQGAGSGPQTKAGYIVPTQAHESTQHWAAKTAMERELWVY